MTFNTCLPTFKKHLDGTPCLTIFSLDSRNFHCQYPFINFWFRNVDAFQKGLSFSEDFFLLMGWACMQRHQGVLKLVSVVSRILDTMILVRHYGLKTASGLRHNCLDSIHSMLDIICITINSDSMGPLSSVRHYVLCTQTWLVRQKGPKTTNTFR